MAKYIKTEDGYKSINSAVDFAAMQSDWNQNDSTSLSYVKNRTHYVNKTKLHFHGEYEGQYKYFHDMTVEEDGDVDKFNFIPGEVYCIIWNDKEFLCKAIEEKVMGDHLFVNTPFYFSYDSDGQFVQAKEEGIYSFSIYLCDYKSLDKGFYELTSNYSHAEGAGVATGHYSHAEGKYNIEDAESKYAHIVGNGTANWERSNAHTLDWNGVGWFQGGLQVGGNAQDDGACYVPAVPTAQLGQTIVVKSVDDNGKPTEWECVDTPKLDEDRVNELIDAKVSQETVNAMIDEKVNQLNINAMIDTKLAEIIDVSEVGM